VTGYEALSREDGSRVDFDFLRSVDSPTIANAIEELEGSRALTEGFLSGPIRCQFPELPVMVGRALTVVMTNAREADPGRRNYWRMWERLEASTEPTVLVIQDASGQPERVAYAGEVMSTLAQRLGAVGIVTDGALRDVPEVRALGLHYFMKYPVVSHADFQVVSVGEPVVLDGQRVVTGDILHGDENGVVIVPEASLPGLPAQVEVVRERERRELELIRSRDFSLASLRPAHSY
jgi:regulator of RNase E activity RraA